MEKEEVTGTDPQSIQPSVPTEAPQPDQTGPHQPGQQEAVAAQEQSAGQAEALEQTDEATTAQAVEEPTSLVRYGRMHLLGEFQRPEGLTLQPGTKVVVRTERGIEIGLVVLGHCEGCGERGITRQRWKEYLDKCGQDYPISYKGQVLRLASEQDLIDQRHLDQNAREKLEFCQKLVKEIGLNMDLVDVEHLFGGDRILFYFKSEKRVDFRRLVRRLAKEYQTRIEMRQVGARDEARLLADFERCGRECCCRSFLKLLAPVNMRMAKVQKATLDPAKISGRCGRLMCCLRYEHYTYETLRKKLPPRNTPVKTPEGEGLVVDRQVLTQLVVVRLADGKRVAYPLAEIELLSGQGDRQGRQEQEQEQESSRQDSVDRQADSAEADLGPDDQAGRPKRRRRKKRGRSKRPKAE